MNTRVITLTLVLAIALMVVPGTVPALQDLSITQDADAKQCVIGYNDDCIIPIVCVTYPCGPPGPDPGP